MAEYQNKMMQHLGIVAGLCNEVKLAELIDCCISQKRRKVSVGQAVQAMIVNAKTSVQKPGSKRATMINATIIPGKEMKRSMLRMIKSSTTPP